MPELRVTQRPEQVLNVSDAEALDLERMGLVVKTQATTDAGARRAAERQITTNTEES